MQSPEQILQHYWGFTSFRPFQKEIITAVNNGQDVVALMPTGGGKSLCYQIPALMNDGLCIVISPLIALMKDQVLNLQSRNINACMLYSGLTYQEVKANLQQAVQGKFKLLYVSPERLETGLFKEHLSSIKVNLIAVDEAHCISQWGYDFRPPYLRIAALKAAVGKVPLLAVTASATNDVLTDISTKLSLSSPLVFRQSFERKNLSYSVFKPDSKLNKTISVLQGVDGSSIVYCKSRRQTKMVADALQLQGFNAVVYHAGLSTEERSTRQQQWVDNAVRVMVCTNAFGMGIDKPDVRSVIHYDMPDCVENYYQEAGRAGRDGKKAYAVLLYNEEDAKQMSELPQVRFPSVDMIKQVYQYTGDFLQVPAGTGEGNYYSFDIITFVQNFKLDIITVNSALKALEQDDYIGFIQSVFIPSTVVFTAAKEVLFDYEKKHPQLEPYIKMLLRNYQGIYDHPASIYEMQLARLLKTDVDEVKMNLQKLHQLGILQYRQQKDAPQLLFVHNRTAAKDLNFNTTEYFKRKKIFTQRIIQLLRYTDTGGCRSRFIAAYFGETDAERCGVCDNCRREKSLPLNNEEFEMINKLIKDEMRKQNVITVKQILYHHQSLSKEKLWKVIHFLRAERKIHVNEEGVISNRS